MAQHSLIAQLSNELEDAGLLGLSAGSLLSLFYMAEGTPGTWSTTDNGLVWSKKLDAFPSGGGEQSVDFGIGRLIIENGLFSCMAGFRFDDGCLTHADVLFCFFQDSGQACQMAIELDEDLAVFADRDTDGDRLVGYKPPFHPARLDLPATGCLEFQFRVVRDGSSRTIHSAVQLYDRLANLADLTSGIIELSTNGKILVLPWFWNIGIGVDKLFLDLSDTSVGQFAAVFPEAYDPSWKGIGATDIALLIPIDAENGEFVVAGMVGFLLDRHGKISLQGTLAYDTPDRDCLLRNITGRIEIWNNELVRSELSATFHFQKAADRIFRIASAAAGGVASETGEHPSCVARKLTEENKDDPLVAFDADLKFQIGLGRHQFGEKYVWGADFVLQSVEIDGTDEGLSFDSPIGRFLLWVLGSSCGGYLVYDGIDSEDSGKTAGGIGLLLLAALDATSFASDSPSWVPTLQTLMLNRLGYRFIGIADGGTRTYIHQVLVDMRARFHLDGVITRVLEAIAEAGLGVADSVFHLFEHELEEITIRGGLDLDFKNVPLAIRQTCDGAEFATDIDKQARRLFGAKDFSIAARELPDIVISETSSDGSDSSKPVVAAQFVTKPGDPDDRYGLAIQLTGFGNSNFAVGGPAMGIVLFFYPEFSMELAPQLAHAPKITFLVPGVVYVEGVIELDKPIPSFDGTQNRVSVDVGLISKEVPLGSALDKDKMAELFVLENYKWQLGGEVAWGEVNRTVYGDAGHFDFIFAELHIEGKSPIVCIGPVGIYGFGGLFGRNIAPGAPGDQRSAQGIAEWITADGDKAFGSVKDWPEQPTDGTWHPARDYAHDEDLYAGGLFIKAGSATDGGKTVIVDAILLGGVPEFWLALAGYALIQPIGGQLAVVVVYDHPSRSFVFRSALEYRIKKDDGNILLVNAPFELGTVSVPKPEFWIYLGHYLAARGEPVSVRLFKDVLDVSAAAYYVFDTRDMPDFGLEPPGDFDRPLIPGPAFGQGCLYKFGPKQYGPDFLHVKLFAAMGYNMAVSFSPFLVYGNLFACGEIGVKIFVFKFSFGLDAYLYGLASPDYYEFGGRITVRIGLPWPFPDIKESFGFSLSSGDSAKAIPAPDFTVSALGMRRLESRPASDNSANDEEIVIPIDGIVALQFNKPVAELIQPAGTYHSDRTRLLANDLSLSNTSGQLITGTNEVETMTTSLANEEYQIVYTHKIDKLSVDGEGASDHVAEMAAAWAAPSLFEDNTPSDDEEHRHALYLNTWVPPELRYHTEHLFVSDRGVLKAAYVPPCKKRNKVCIMQTSPLPDVQEAGASELRRVFFATDLGDMRIEEKTYRDDPLPLVPCNLSRLEWRYGALQLPEHTQISVPDADIVELRLWLHTVCNPDVLDYIEIQIDVTKRATTEIATVILRLDQTQAPSCPCNLDLKYNTVHPDVLHAEAEITECLCSGEVRLKVTLAHLNRVHSIVGIEVRGPFISLKPALIGSLVASLQHEKQLAALEKGTSLCIEDLCIRQAASEREPWRRTDLANWGSEGPPGSSENEEDTHAGTPWDSFLFKPDHQYKIRFEVHSDARATCQSGEMDEINQAFPPSEPRTIQFRTEAVPSQDVGKYVGFTFPDQETSPLYTWCFLPICSLKYRGLIKQIYRRHYGGDVLKTRVVDMEGISLQKRRVSLDTLGSDPTDFVLNALLGSCLPAAETMVYLEVEVWERALTPDSWYSLQLHDTSNPALLKTPFSVRFKTSKYRLPLDHTRAIEALFEEAVQIPMVDHLAVSSALASEFAGILGSDELAHDALVERLYARLLGLDGGRLAPLYGHGQDLAAYLVDRDASGSLQVWGIAVELAEPLFTKEGMEISGVPAAREQARDRGIIFIQNGPQNRIVCHDRSGSRMLIFNSADAVQFNTIQTETRFGLSFRPDQAVKAAIRRYVDRTFPGYSVHWRGGTASGTWNELKREDEEIAKAFKDRDVSLTLPSA